MGAFLLVNPRVTVVGILVMILSSAVMHLVKAAYPTLRPAELLSSGTCRRASAQIRIIPLRPCRAASMSAGLAIAFFCRSRVIVAIVITIALLIGLSRIFVGAHFPADVLGGMICALTVFLVFAIAVWPILEKHVPEHPSLSRPRFRVALCFEVLAVLFALFVYAPFLAELPPFGALVALVVLVFVAAGYRRISSGQDSTGTNYF